jgi:cytochrome bd ubiquinol oxidase subunit II
VIIAGLCGLAVLALLTASRPRGIRVLAALGVAAVIWGWGVAQYPALLPGTAVTLSNAGAPDATLVAIVWLFIVVVLVIGPSFALLFWLQGRRLLQAGHGETLAAAGLASGTQPPAVPPRQEPPAWHLTVTRGAVLTLAVIVALIRRRHR